MKACHFLMLTDWFEEMIRNWLQLVCTSFRIKWVNAPCHHKLHESEGSLFGSIFLKDYVKHVIAEICQEKLRAFEIKSFGKQVDFLAHLEACQPCYNTHQILTHTDNTALYEVKKILTHSLPNVKQTT